MTANPQQLIAQVQALIGAGDEEEAAVELASAAQGGPLTFEQARRLAVQARSIDRNDLALTLLDRAPSSPAMEAMQLQLRMELGEPVADALASVAGPSAPLDLTLQLAGALHAEGRLQEAVDLLEAKLTGSPSWIAGHQTLAQLRWHAGEGNASHRTLRAAATAQPANEQLWIAWLAMMKMMADWDAFPSAAQGAMRRFPRSAGVAAMIADGLSEKGDTDQADRLFDALDGVTDPALDGARLRHLMRVHRFADAARRGAEAVQRHGHPECWAWLAAAWRLLEDPRSDWFHRGEDLIGTFELDYSEAERTALAARLRQLHEMSAQPLGQSPRGGTQTQGPLLKRGEPEIRDLRRRLRRAVRSYIDGLPPADPAHPFLSRRRRGFRFEGAWSILLRPSGHHVPHIHSHGWISSALYIDVPDTVSQSAEGEGWLDFGVPLLPSPFPGTPLTTRQPVNGRLVLFPSMFWHGTRPFASGERLTVAFDLVVA